MKRFLFWMVMFITTGQLFGQKADIDNYWVDISTAILPDNKVAPENRTFSIRINGDADYTGADVTDNVRVFGWKKTDENPYLELVADVGSFTKGSPSTSSRRVDNTDKNGKVTSSTTYYKVTANNYNRGKLYVKGAKNSYREMLKNEEDMKKKAEKEKKEMEKKEKEKDKKKESKEEKAKREMENNPFLKNVETAVAEVPDAAEAKTDAAKDVAYEFSLDNSYEYQTRESTSSVAASKEYSDNSYSAFLQHKEAYKRDLASLINNNMNYYYGYRPVKEVVKFKRLDSEDHPEFNMFDNATKAMKVILEKMRYNQSIDQIKKDLEPIIGYFNSVAMKLKSSDQKHEKRLRAACYYNLAQLYYYLDEHDKVIEIGNAIIQSKHDEDDGEMFIEKAEIMKKALAFHDMKSRHVDMANKDESTEELGETLNENAKN